LRRGLFRRRVGAVDALDGVSLELRQGETLGVVGESGSGKTTLGRALLRLVPSEGTIRFEGRAIEGLDRAALRPLRQRMQIVFQDPFGSLSPRMSLARIVGEGLRVNGLAGRAKDTDRAVCEALEDVGIDPAWRQRYPHELSGGQRQRVAIARAIILRPRLIVLDEPTSALDRSVQAQIVELLRALQRRYRIAYLFISHDLKVVRALANQVMVLKDGRMVEFGDGDEIFVRPRHPYTKALLAAAFELEAAGTEETRT
jgi:microcin C transport system ATP-binding protein